MLEASIKSWSTETLIWNMLTAIKVVKEATMTISELWDFLPADQGVTVFLKFQFKAIPLKGDNYKQLEVLFLGPF